MNKSLYPPPSPNDIPLLSPPSALLDAQRRPLPLSLAPRLQDILANYCIRGVPGWDHLKEQDIEITPMKKGMTNQLFIAQLKHKSFQEDNQIKSQVLSSQTTSNNHSSNSVELTGASPSAVHHEKVVIRVFGHDTSTFFDREYEEYITRRLSKRGIGSRILTEFGSGRIEAFLEGRTLECVDLSDPRISYLCAKAMGALHSKHIPITADLIERTKLKVKQDADKLLPVDPVERERALSVSKMQTFDNVCSNQPNDNSPTGSMRNPSEPSVSLVASFDQPSMPNSPVAPVKHILDQSANEHQFSDMVNQSDAASISNAEAYMEPLLYFRMRHWFNVARQLTFDDPSNKAIFESLDLTSDTMSSEVEWLCDKLASLNSPIVFCHNDLQEGNLILDVSTKPHRKRTLEASSQSDPVSKAKHMPSSHQVVEPTHHDKSKLTVDTSGRSASETVLTSNVSFSSLHRVMSSPHSPTSHQVKMNHPLDCDEHSVYGHWRLYMIDFEYSSYNPRGFDLANHLCEHGIDYNCSAWPGFIIHGFPPNVPDKTHTLRFLETYLTHFKRASRDDSAVTKQELQDLTREALWFTLASHFKWAMWGIVQAARSKIHFGYMEYAQQRMQCYKLAKRQLLAWADDGMMDWPSK